MASTEGKIEEREHFFFQYMYYSFFRLRRHAWNWILNTSALVKQINNGSDTEVLHIIHDLEIINVTHIAILVINTSYLIE